MRDNPPMGASRLGFFVSGLFLGAVVGGGGLAWMVRDAVPAAAVRGAGDSWLVGLLWGDDEGTKAASRNPTPGTDAGDETQLGSSEPESVVADEVFTIGPAQVSKTIVRFQEPRLLDISVLEQLGREIEFRVVHGESNLYFSGVHEGLAEGQVLIKVDSVMVSVENRDPFESRDVHLRIVSKPIAGDVYLGSGRVIQR